jgi:transmembrane sensor
MERSEAEILLSKYNRGEATTKEIAILESWYLEEGFSAPLFEGNLDYEFRRQSILSKIQQHRNPVRKTIKLWPRIAIAATMATAIFSAALFFFKHQQKEITQNVAIINDIVPGHHGATLTLTNGKKIRLNEVANGELAKEAGVVITKSANGDLIYEIKDKAGESNKVNTLSTAKGEMYNLRLPDGSHAWLNAASSLTYAANLIKNGHRKVKLDGEAYFEVAKDKAHPFVVETKGQEVEVLGTHFNVNAYGDELVTKTTLLEGSVKLTAGRNKQILKPEEQAINNGKTIKVAPVNTESVIDWKEGDFYFEQVDFRSVMREIGRWYDVEVIYDPSVPENIISNGLISRNNKLSTVLKAIEKSGQIHFKIDGKKVYVTN